MSFLKHPWLALDMPNIASRPETRLYVFLSVLSPVLLAIFLLLCGLYFFEVDPILPEHLRDFLVSNLIENVIFFMLIFPIIGILIILLIPKKEKKLLKIIALHFSFILFCTSLILCIFFNRYINPYVYLYYELTPEFSFQFTSIFFWLPTFNLNIMLGIDGISIFFLLLTTLLIPLCLLTSWSSINFNLKEFLIAFLILDFFLIGTFCVLDLLIFYIFFESVLIPMFLIIGIWGSRDRKILASYYFFLYTLFGSILMLLSIIYIYNQIGTTNYEVLLTFSFSQLEQKFLWFAFFLAFASKVPMMPLHLWLPEAHVEAPTSGSVLLAGILLKLGTYGFIRFSLPLFPKACFFFAPLVYTIAVMGILYTSFTAIRQTDFKRIIAYTSIAHMNLVILGIFSFNNIGLEGALLQSLSHGFVASALFLIIGVIYDRYKTRLIHYYGGFILVMPLYSFIFLFFTMANISFPGTSNFVGEFLILLGSFSINSTITFLGAICVILGSVYSLWLLNRIIYGNFKVQYTKQFLDISLKEFIVFLPLLIGTILIGLYPNFFLISIHMSINNLIELMCF